MVVRPIPLARSDVLDSFVENSIPNSLDARTMSHAGLAGTIMPFALIGLVFTFISPVLVGGQGLLPGVQPDPATILKEYSGYRVSDTSNRQVYYHDQAIVVVELGPGKELLNCEIIEVYTNVDLALAKHNFSAISKPIMINFQEIGDLMQKCHDLPTPTDLPDTLVSENPEGGTTAAINFPPRAGRPGENPMSLFSGIMPGTKWCGLGDIAKSYFDLGASEDMDKCCRSHDLCPAKVRAFNARYNLTNYSLYTKSHCTCDTLLYNCLKATKNPRANVVGNIYFNVVRVPCVEEVGCEGKSCARNRRFRVARKRY